MAVAMTATLRDPAGDTSESALAEAYRALDSGLAEKARGLAQSTLIAARASASRHPSAGAGSGPGALNWQRTNDLD